MLPHAIRAGVPAPGVRGRGCHGSCGASVSRSAQPSSLAHFAAWTPSEQRQRSSLPVGGPHRTPTCAALRAASGAAVPAWSCIMRLPR